MTDFVDIVHQSGIPKATKVKQVKLRPDYQPAFDFYKTLREAIVDTHVANADKPHFQALAGAVSDPKKKANYPAVITGYSRWWGRKQLQWFIPPRATHISSGVHVIVNPELGLSWGGQKHVIKLYFKDARLDRYRVDLLLDLMEHNLRGQISPGTTVSVLDVRASRLYSHRGGQTANLPIVNAELAYIANLWPQI